MAQIVDLNAGRVRLPRGGAVPGSGARILFFTGVRYERVTDGREVAGQGPPHPVQADAPSRSALGAPLDLAAH